MSSPSCDRCGFEIRAGVPVYMPVPGATYCHVCQPRSIHRAAVLSSVRVCLHCRRLMHLPSRSPVRFCGDACARAAWLSNLQRERMR